MYNSFEDVLINAGAYLIASLVIGCLYWTSKDTAKSEKSILKSILMYFFFISVLTIFIGASIDYGNSSWQDTKWRLLFLTIIFTIPVICGLIEGYGSRKKFEKINAKGKNMDIDRALEIVKVYSKIVSALLTQPPKKKYSIGFLPYPKEEIKQALSIKIALVSTLEENERTKALKIMLKVLDRFEANQK